MTQILELSASGIKDAIRRRGENISAFEVEEVLLRDARLVVEVAARQDARQLLADDRVVV